MVAGTPLALLGLLLLPALVAIYLLVTRRRRLEVSAAFLFRDPRRAAEGGRRLERLQTPLLLLLELLALLFLVLAAASLALRTRSEGRPLVFVLDDSFSMRAGADASARRKGERAIAAAIASDGSREIHAVLAGPRPRTLGRAATPDAASALLAGWTCLAPGADLPEAIVLARQLAGPRARLVVVTDHPPARDAASVLEWWAFGVPRPNAAIVEASRTTSGAGERARVVVAAFGPGSLTTTLTAGEPPVAHTLALAPGERRAVDVTLGPSAGPVTARLAPGDALDVDDVVTLLPARRPPVRVALDLAPGPLRDLMERSLEAAGAELQTQGVKTQGVRYQSSTLAELVVTDHAPATDGSDPWTLELRTGKGTPFAGPFVVDTAHPLVDGVSLAGVIWGAPRADVAGHAVVSAGSVPLLVDGEAAAGRHLVLALSPDLSTLPRSPAWPALLWNLLDWRASFRAGAVRPNVALGGAAVVNVPAARDVTLTTPDGARRRLVPDDGRVTFVAERPGLHVVTADDDRREVSVNPLDAAESDLSGCGPARTGADASSAAEGSRLRDVAWLPALLALAALTAHRAVVVHGAGEAA